MTFQSERATATLWCFQTARRLTGATWPQVYSLITQATNDATLGDDLDTEARIDGELLAQGIGPGDPSLYPEPELAADEHR